MLKEIHWKYLFISLNQKGIPVFCKTHQYRAKVYVIYCHANGEVMNEQLIRTMSSLLKMLDVFHLTFVRMSIDAFEYGLLWVSRIRTHAWPSQYKKLLFHTRFCNTICPFYQYTPLSNHIVFHMETLELNRYGRSIGAAFASRYCAEHEDVDGIILESPFSEIHHVIRGCCCCFRCCTPNIKCAEYLSSIQIPKLLIYGTRDPLNPPQTQQVYIM